MYVQTKGRARSKDSSFILFSSELEQQKISEQIHQYRKAHTEIGEYLKDRVLERTDPQMDEMNEHFQDEIQPFINKNGAVLLASSALALLHRYCQQMPSDAFGIVLPWFKLLEPEEVKKFTSDWQRKHIVSITLPLNSTLREAIYVSQNGIFIAQNQFSFSSCRAIPCLVPDGPRSRRLLRPASNCTPWANSMSAFCPQQLTNALPRSPIFTLITGKSMAMMVRNANYRLSL